MNRTSTNDMEAGPDPAALPRILAAVAKTLESVDGSSTRLVRALELLRIVIPFEQAGLLRLPRHGADDVVLFPEPSAEQRLVLGARLRRLARLLGVDSEPGGDGEKDPVESGPDRVHAALPLVGLDQLVGVLLVERTSDVPYDESSLAALAVVASELGAYLTLAKLVEEQAQAARELARTREFQQLLIGIVSRDLRTPLSVITAAAGLQLQMTPDAELRKALDLIVSSAARADGIIYDLLDVTQTRMGQGIAVNVVAMDLDALARSAVDDARALDPARRIEYASSGPFLGQGDVERLRQALGNVLGNALRYGDDGAPIVVRLGSAPEGAALSIHNFGPPIADVVLPQLFDPFGAGPAAATTRTVRGLGLGLYIAREIVAAHGGRVDVRSTSAEGTTFTLVIPRFARAALDSEAGIVAAISRSGRPVNLLVVDDDDDIREALMDVLAAEDYRVAGAYDGRDALASMRANRPDLVVLDLMMPVMDGVTVVAEMRSDPSLVDLPVVIVSASETEHASDGVEFLRKPVNIDTLLASIRRRLPNA